MGCWERTEPEGGSSSGTAQSSLQFLSYTEDSRSSVQDWTEQVMGMSPPLGKIPLPA